MIKCRDETKSKREVWASGEEGVSCGKVTRKCMINKGCSVRFVMQIRLVLLRKRGNTLQKEICHL